VKHLLLGLGLLGFGSQGLAAPSQTHQQSPLAPQPTSCITSSFTSAGSQFWKNITLTLTNECDQVIDFQNSTVTFAVGAPLETSFWGDFGNLSYPDNVLTISSQPEGNGSHLAALQLHFPAQPWANTKLPPQRSIHIKYGVEQDTHIEGSTKVYTGHVISSGNIEFRNASAKPEHVHVHVHYALIHLSMNGKNVTDVSLPWGSSEIITGLTPGIYTASAEAITDTLGNVYQGVAAPSSIEVASGQTSNSVIKYTVSEEAGKVVIKTTPLPDKLNGHMENPTVSVTNTQSGSSKSESIAWNASTTIAQLTSGHSYHLSTAAITYNNHACVPQFSPEQLVASATNPPVSTLSYQCSFIGQDEVPLSVNGAPASLTSLKVTFTPNNGAEPVSYTIPLNNGSGTSSVSLLHSMIYTVSTESVPGYSISFSPQPLLASIDAIETITLKAVEAPKGRIIGYLTGWKTPPSAKTLAGAGYTHIMVAFGVFSTSVPGGVTPAFHTISKEYIASLHEQGIKVILSLGGALTSIHNTTVDFHQALSLASSEDEFQQTFMSSLQSLLTEYGFDGFDIDIEHGLNGGGTFTQPQGDIKVLASIINAMHAQNPDLLITLTPQVANVSATRGFDQTWGNYASLILQTHDALAWVGIQLYNTGCAFGIDLVCYAPTVNPDFSVAMATDLLENWPATLANGTSTGFQPYISYLNPSQVVLGYLAPNSTGVGDGNPIISFPAIKRSIQCLRTGVAGNTSCDNYIPPRAYGNIGGVFNWEVSYDQDNGFKFASDLKNCVIHGNCE
jgi:chitinase